MKVQVDQERCMGHGMCSALAPSLYRINVDTGFNEMGEFEISLERRADAERGVAACPERAISILTGSTG